MRAVVEYQKTAILRDYLSLAKPRTILPHFITAAAAMFLAAEGPPPGQILTLTLMGGGLVAASANVLNCYFDRDIDRMMPRTQDRPLPAGRLSPVQALAFGAITGFAGISILTRSIGLAAAGLALAALAYYVLVYTLCLKRRTCWSAIIGSGAGAITPLVGWAAVASRLEPAAFLLAAIVALWTLPHFWSLAIFRRLEYRLAAISPLPGLATRWIMVCAFLLVLVTLFLAPVAGSGIIYLAAASALGSILVGLAIRLNLGKSRASRHLYSYSIVYLATLFLAIIVDRLSSPA